MAKMRRERCPVCDQPVALNWRSREMAYHLESFLRSQKALVTVLSKFEMDSLGGNKYEKVGQEIMHHVVSLNRLIQRAERGRR